MTLLAQAAAAAAPSSSGGLSSAEVLSIALSACGALVIAVVALWRLDRAQLVDRVKEATDEAEKNLVRYDQATKRFDSAVAELAAVKAELARLQGRLEGPHPNSPIPLPPPSFPRKPT